MTQAEANFGGLTKEEFHKLRATGLGGSDISAVMGISPWKTPYQLWQEKTGKVIPEDISNLPHVQRGIVGEKVALPKLELKYETKFLPTMWADTERPYFRCSDDGYSVERGILIETKVMGVAKHEEAKQGKIPPYYFAQLQWNMWVSKCNHGVFASYNPELMDLVTIDVKPDIAYMADLVDHAEYFWANYVKLDLPPPFMKGDVIDAESAPYADHFKTLASTWHTLRSHRDDIVSQIEDVEAELKSYADDLPAIKGYGVSITATVRPGTISYKKVVDDSIAKHLLSEEDLAGYVNPVKRIVSIRAVKPSGDAKTFDDY